ncbi:CAP domain-containing protein [Furfurilactobacillus curtus]|uniref:SCP domain-containing protein n=1 Tax=Furfurilactobacillus curtus TaxID=1746200 RepID=A0ABQ5JPX5_9LACO
MKNYLEKKHLHRQSKITNFRRWKSGKQWLYAASILTLMAGGAAVEQIETTSVHADTISTTQSSVASSSVAINNLSNSSATTSQASVAVSSAIISSDPVSSMESGTAITRSSAATVAEVSSSAVESSATAVNVSSTAPSQVSTSEAALNNNEPALSQSISQVASSGQTSVLDTPISQADIALATVSSTATATSSAVSSTSVVAPDLSGVVAGIGAAYNETLSGVITQLIGSAGVSNAVTLLTNVISQAGSFFSSVPGISNVVTVANGVLNGVTQAINLANGLGIDPSGLVVTAITNGMNGLGQAALTALTPIINNIPVIGSGLLSVVKPILSNLSNVSPSLVVSTLASATGLGGVLSTVSNIAASVAPQVINAVQGVLNTAVNVINGVKGFINNAMNVVAPILQPIENVINGLIAPIQTVLSNIISSIKNAIFPNTSSNATTSSSSATNSSSSATTSSSSSATSSSSAVSVKPALVTKATTIRQGSSWNALQNFVSATGSNGQKVSLSEITMQGTIDPQVPGLYYIMFQFADPVTKAIIQNMAAVTVQAIDPVAESSAASEVALASSAVAQDIVAVSAATSAINALPHSTSNLTSLFPSTSNYPSSQVVYLSAASSAATPDVSVLGSDVMQYVNELRSANGQPALTYSSSEAAFAQTRAQQIVTDFSHDKSNGSTEDIGGSRGITDQMQSPQEMAYFIVMDWYDESDNPEAVGNGHYGHRANLLFGGPTMGVGFVRSTDPTTTFTDYYSFEAPAYQDVTLYNQAEAMANAKSNPSTIPLPNITFVYVDSPDFDLLYNKLTQLQQQLASDQAALAAAQNKLLTV